MMAYGEVNRNSKVELTPAGKDVHDNGRFGASFAQDVLVYLNDNGASRVFDIADYNNTSDMQAIKEVQRLVKEGYIQVAREGSDNF